MALHGEMEHKLEQRTAVNLRALAVVATFVLARVSVSGMAPTLALRYWLALGGEPRLGSTPAYKDTITASSDRAIAAALLCTAFVRDRYHLSFPPFHSLPVIITLKRMSPNQDNERFRT